MSEQDKEETPIFTDLGRQQEDGHAIHHPDTDHGVEFEDWGDIIDWDRVLTQAGAGILDLPEVVADHLAKMMEARSQYEAERKVLASSQDEEPSWGCSVPVPCPPFEETTLNVEAVWWEPVPGEGEWISPEEFNARVENPNLRFGKPETKVYVLDDHADFPEPVPVNGASDWEMGVSPVSYPEEEK